MLIHLKFMAKVGFTGSRKLDRAYAALAESAVELIWRKRRGKVEIIVGCAAGLDSFVREACRNHSAEHHIYEVAGGKYGSGAGAFAKRSIALIDALIADRAGSALICFPDAPCPAKLAPHKDSKKCFAGYGSGTWATAAYARGNDLPVIVFPCAGRQNDILPRSWGNWTQGSGDLWQASYILAASPREG